MYCSNAYLEALSDFWAGLNATVSQLRRFMGWLLLWLLCSLLLAICFYFNVLLSRDKKEDKGMSFKVT